MQRLGHRLFPPPAAPRVLTGTGHVLPAACSSAHLVFMHGLLGAHRNFASVCTAMSGAQAEESLRAEAAREPLKAVACAPDCDEAAGCRPRLEPAAAPRAYPCAAFDWRCHGDSAHTPDVSLDGLADDVSDFLTSYAAAQAVAGTPPSPSPLPLILVAHSMGALALMHWMWKAHVELWRDRVLHPSPTPVATTAASGNPLVANAAYRVIGVVLIDTAPAARPSSFQDTRRLIEYLRRIPLEAVRTRAEAETWLLQNGPQDICTPANIWLLRYQLSNLTFTRDAPPSWKVGLDEIISGLDHISWCDGGEAVLATRRRVESLARAQGLPPPSPPPPLHEVPVYCIFGATSPYNTPASRAAVRQHFAAPCVVEMADSNHFLFMMQKRTFVHTLQSMCYAVERAGGTL
ncbi:Alpha/beta hydrolase family [Novymonas esmeraldas]|uniref:Alpha/beta hydrolase family n=1 Tax=Novymonas esmeraldas TaxID=1808958 RepID=A0AAW0ENY5_9TRYP